MDQESREYLVQKVQILAQILQDQQLSGPDIKQEVWEEAEISSRLQSSFFLRVLDARELLVAETPGMASDLPISAFPTADSTEPQVRRLHSAASQQDFLLASAAMPPSSGVSSRMYIEAALNVSAEESLLSTYRRYIAVVLVCGLLIASAVGAVITRHGLRPIADITRATEHIGVQHLRDRIRARPWPKELVSLASAFDRMLDRLQEAFEQLSQFSADVAHEFRTPINNLTGEAQVALSRERTARGVHTSASVRARRVHPPCRYDRQHAVSGSSGAGACGACGGLAGSTRRAASGMRFLPRAGGGTRDRIGLPGPDRHYRQTRCCSAVR